MRLGDGGTRERAFWVTPRVRRDLAAYLRDHHDDLYAEVTGFVSVVGHEPELSHWGGILFEQATYQRVDVYAGDGRFAEAARVIAAARAVGDLLGAPFSDTARRLQWRLDRAFREQEDERLLAHYLPRHEIENAVASWLSFDDERWALHLLGSGGVGKTMVIRRLGSIAGDLPGNSAVARVDFDHLDPRYPENRPGDILLAIADELLGYASTRASTSSYRRLADDVITLHETLADPHHDPALAEEQLKAATRAFAGYVTEARRPVVLVLDTCEELAKLYLPGAAAPAIDRTWRILELVHQAAPSVRVVLAGRRRLVSSPSASADGTAPVLRPRPYVRVLEMGGFTRTEAESYMAVRGVAQALHPALLAQAVQDDRYNPFDLAAYSEWALAEPSLSADDLADAHGDPYVERRIIGRIHDDGVRAALAVAAEVDRLDRNLADPSLNRMGVDPGPAFEGLASQEWVRVLGLTPDGRPHAIEIDEHLRDRIRAAVPARLDRHLLGRDAAAVVARSDLDELPVETVEAAVRLLPPAEAAELWRELEDRIVAVDAWGWAAQVTTRVAATEAERSGPSILAAVLATQAASHIHTGQQHDLVTLWDAVELHAPRHPTHAAELATRAVLGRIAARDEGDDPVPAVKRALRLGLYGSLAAAADRGLLPPMGTVDELSASVGIPQVDAAIEVFRAKVYLFEERVDDALAASGRALGQAEAAEAEVAEGAEPRHWADWVPPRHLVDHCRLARLVVERAAGGTFDSQLVRDWARDALTRVEDIDAERLVGAAISFERRRRTVDAEFLEEVEAAEVYIPYSLPAWPRSVTLPLIVELAVAWDSLGDAERATELLRRRMEEAASAGDDPATIDACRDALDRLSESGPPHGAYPSPYPPSYEPAPSDSTGAFPVPPPLQAQPASQAPQAAQASPVYAQQPAVPPSDSTYSAPRAAPFPAPARRRSEGAPWRFLLLAGAGLVAGVAGGLWGLSLIIGTLPVLTIVGATVLIVAAAYAGLWVYTSEQWRGRRSRLRVLPSGSDVRIDITTARADFVRLEMSMGGARDPRTGQDSWDIELSTSTWWHGTSGELLTPAWAAGEPRMTICLSVEPALALFKPWERWLPYGLEGRTHRDLLVWRLAPGRPPEFSEPEWRTAPRLYLGPRHLGGSTVITGSGRLQHLVGTPVSTHAGWYLRIGGVARPMSKGEKGRIREDEGLLSAQDLAGGSNSLVVLQADPVEGPPRPLGELRDGFVRLALAVMEEDVTAVLVVPPVGDALARSIVRRIDSVAAEWPRPPGTETLIDLQREIKGYVAGAEVDEAIRPGLDHACLDVMLFAKTGETG